MTNKRTSTKVNPGSDDPSSVQASASVNTSRLKPQKVALNLPDVAPLVSKQRVRKAEGAIVVRLKREEGKQSIGFSSRPFVLCSLPVRKPEPDQLVYRRRNGNFFVEIVAHPDFGLPYGQDRLIPIFLATLAVKRKTRSIRFATAQEMLDTFGIANGGREYRRMVDAFNRIRKSTIWFGTEEQIAQAKVISDQSLRFVEKARIWYSNSRDQRSLIPEFENEVVLSPEFYEEISRHPIPVDLEAVKVLASAPAALDLFVWLNYRTYTAQDIEFIPIFGDYGLVHQLGNVEYSRPRRFRAALDSWLKLIHSLWPQCPAEIDKDGTRLLIRPGQAILSAEKSSSSRIISP